MLIIKHHKAPSLHTGFHTNELYLIAPQALTPIGYVYEVTNVLRATGSGHVQLQTFSY